MKPFIILLFFFQIETHVRDHWTAGIGILYFWNAYELHSDNIKQKKDRDSKFNVLLFSVTDGQANGDQRLQTFILFVFILVLFVCPCNFVYFPSLVAVICFILSVDRNASCRICRRMNQICNGLQISNFQKSLSCICNVQIEDYQRRRRQLTTNSVQHTEKLPKTKTP